MAKKDGKAKLPRKVGGVKLPKQLRKSAGVIADIAQNPVARDVVSAALVAGATALAKRRTRNHAAPGAAEKPDGEFSNLIAQGQEIGNMISQGINAFVGALLKPAEKQPETAPKAAPTKTASASAKPASTKPASAKSRAKREARKSAPAERKLKQD